MDDDDAVKSSRPLTVLFCGHGFEQGFRFSVEEAQPQSDVQVKRCRQEELMEFIGEADVLVPLMAKLDGDVLRQAKRAKLILQYGVGLEGIDIPTATECGILVSNMPAGPTGNALSCAEMAIYLSLACLRDQAGMTRSVQNKVLGLPCAKTLFGSECLIVGYGSIAQELIPRLKPFGVNLSCVRRSIWAGSQIEDLVDKKGRWTDLHDFVETADVIFLCCILNQDTRNLVNRKLLQRCKKGVVIVNISRGGLLDYDSVMDGLDSGKIGALGVDVMWQEPFDPDDPILKHPNVYVTPHVGGVTQLSYRSMAQTLAREVQRLKEGQLPTIRCNSVEHIRRC